MATKRQKWNKEASQYTIKLISKSAGCGVQYIREILRGDRVAGLKLAAKISDAIKKNCPEKTVITARSLMDKEEARIADRIHREKGK